MPNSKSKIQNSKFPQVSVFDLHGMPTVADRVERELRSATLMVRDCRKRRTIPWLWYDYMGQRVRLVALMPLIASEPHITICREICESLNNLQQTAGPDGRFNSKSKIQNSKLARP